MCTHPEKSNALSRGAIKQVEAQGWGWGRGRGHTVGSTQFNTKLRLGWQGSLALRSVSPEKPLGGHSGRPKRCHISEDTKPLHVQTLQPWTCKPILQMEQGKTYLSLICRAQFWLQKLPPERHSSALPYWQQFSQNWSPSVFDVGSFNLKGTPVFSEKTEDQKKKKRIKTVTEGIAEYK